MGSCYPFGLRHKGYNNVVNGTHNKYKMYNGKELEESLGLNLYEMDIRQYDPAIARWTSIDPVVHYSMSPYNAFDNNPIFWADPSGADSYHYDWDAHERGEKGVYVNNKTGESTNDWQAAISETQNELSFPLSNAPTNSEGGTFSEYNYESSQGANMATFGSNRSRGKRKHAARDLYTDGSQDVLSMTTGTVLEVKAFYAGTYQITIQHDYQVVEGSNVILRYGELDGESIKIKAGDKVKQGQVIGKTGKLIDAQGSPVLTLKGQNIYMLHLEAFTGAAGNDLKSKPLTNRANGKYQRRSDLIDPIGILRKAYNNTFKKIKD